MLGVAVLCLVVGVTDGDTLTARCGEPGATRDMPVRIAAIFAPEKNQPHADEATQQLAELCLHQEAAITPRRVDPKLPWTIADVKCQDQDAAAHLVRAGKAWVFDRCATGYLRLYDLQDGSRRKKVGLWAEEGVVKP